MFGWFKKNKNKKEDLKQAPKPVKETVNEEPKKEVKEEVKEDQKAPKKRKAAMHITKHKDGGWQVKKGGAQRALRKFDTQKEAIEFAKKIEQEKGTGYIIHKADGSTRKKLTSSKYKLHCIQIIDIISLVLLKNKAEFFIY